MLIYAVYSSYIVWCPYLCSREFSSILQNFRDAKITQLDQTTCRQEYVLTQYKKIDEKGLYESILLWRAKGSIWRTPGFRSRWRTFRSWVCFIASEICTKSWSTSLSFIRRPLLLFKNWSRSPPRRSHGYFRGCAFKFLDQHFFNNIEKSHRQQTPSLWRDLIPSRKSPKSWQYSDDSGAQASSPLAAFALPPSVRGVQERSALWCIFFGHQLSYRAKPSRNSPHQWLSQPGVYRYF